MTNNVQSGQVPKKVPKEVPNTRHPLGGPKHETSCGRSQRPDKLSSSCLRSQRLSLVPNDILSQSMSCPTGCLIMSLGPPRGCLWDLHGLFLEVWGSSPNYRALAESRALLQKEIEQNKMRYLAKYHYTQRMFLLRRSLFV